MTVTPAPFDQAISFLPIEMLAESEHFYGELLGLKLVYQRQGVRIYAVGEGYLGLISAPGRKASPGGLTFAICTADVDLWHDRLQAAGCPIDVPPQFAPALDTYFFMTRDPNGYRIEVLEIRDSGWPKAAAARQRGE